MQLLNNKNGINILKRVYYCITFAWISNVTVSAAVFWTTDARGQALRDVTGILMAGVILLHYKWGDMEKYRIPLFVWAVLGVFASYLVVIIPWTDSVFLADKGMIAANVYVYGFVLILTVGNCICRCAYKRTNLRLFVLFAVMLLWACLSRNEHVWPFVYLVMFGCMYLTDYAKDETELLFLGVSDGLILGFLIHQGIACLIRPWDRYTTFYRYYGLFDNAIPYAMIVATCGMAVIWRILRAGVYKSPLAVKLLLYALLGFQTGVLIMTGTRSAWVSEVLVIIAYILIGHRFLPIKKLTVTLIAMGVSCMLLIYPTYLILRYIPAYAHHPVWFRAEYSENVIHSWDDVDDWRYVKFSEIMNVSFGRIAETAGQFGRVFGLYVDADALPKEIDNSPLYESKEEYEESGEYRTAIWKHYLKYQNVVGHHTGELDVAVAEGLFVQSGAMNVFLEYSTEYGIPFIIMYLFLFIYSGIYFFRNGIKGDISCVLGFFIITNLLALGMFDYMTDTINAHEFLVFVAWLPVMKFYKQ